MDADEPALFHLPRRETPPPVPRTPRGRNRETWTRTASAEVRIIDAEAVLEALTRAEAEAVTIGLVADENTEAEEPRRTPPREAINALAWLIWPTDDREPLVEADAFRVLRVTSDVQAASADHGTLTWTVTVKLRDVQALRRIAAQAQPTEAAQIRDSLAVAWQHAADPFEPLRSIPGITWQPGEVEVVLETTADWWKH